MVFCLAGSILFSSCKQNSPKKPNIIIIYADDLGYGDIGVNGAVGVETPNIDRLAAGGVNFTDAHCTAATCTPSRYSLLTGRYAFRDNAAILPGDAGLIIKKDYETLPGVLQKAGYFTGVVGKWHLGLGDGNINWNQKITPGPNEIGFDYSFLIPATGDRVPCVFVQNGEVVGLAEGDSLFVSYEEDLGGYPVGEEEPELLTMHPSKGHDNSIINGISRIGFMKGAESALWKDEDFPFVLINQAKTFITESEEKPFFLYWAFHDIHVPRVPNEQFVGESTMGPRGDAIAQMDWCVGELLKYLNEEDLLTNTLIIFSSDNGPILDDGYIDQAEELLGDHHPAGMFSGGKYSMLEGATRVPTIVSWPGVIESRTSDALLSQVDLMASLASLVNQPLLTSSKMDSEDYLEAWLGHTQIGREFLLEEGFSLALRMKHWKYIKPFERPTPAWLEYKKVRTGLSGDPQLYSLLKDPQEKENLAGIYSDTLAYMEQQLESVMQ